MIQKLTNVYKGKQTIQTPQQQKKQINKQIITPSSQYLQMKSRKNKVDQQYDILKKVIIIGDSGVGKSNILLRYSEGKFVDNYMMTIGLNFVYKISEIDGLKIKMQIWDTAGQDKYKTITQNYYKNCNGAFVVFSIDSKESFFSVRNWIEDLAQTAPQTTQIMLVGNKMDLEQQREVTTEEARDFAKQYSIPYMECSAKSGQSINEAFQMLGKMMKDENERKTSDSLGANEKPNNPPVEIRVSNQPRKTLQERCCST